MLFAHYSYFLLNILSQLEMHRIIWKLKAWV